MSAIDHIALGLSRIVTQYQGQPNFTAFVTSILDGPQNLETAMQDVLSSVDIDVAVGSQLDLLGDIVGMSRTLLDTITSPFFGFDSIPNALPYGDEIFGGGGLFYEEGAPAVQTFLVGDPLYRKFIRAMVIRNRSTGVLEDFIAVLRAIFPADTILAEDVPGQLQVNYGLNRPTTPAEDVLLSFTGIMPKPAGVAVVHVPYTQLVIYFGFNPTDATYGDDVIGGGGPFAEDRY